MTFRIAGAVLIAASAATALAAPKPEDTWPGFRGHEMTGVAPAAVRVPERWSTTENVKWKTPLPGEGVSSPIVVGDRLFVTTYSGYGFEDGALAATQFHPEKSGDAGATLLANWVSDL